MTSTVHPHRRVLICGAGIAGLTLASLLQRAAWCVTLIEIAPEPRGPEYMIDFFGPGFDAAEQMDLLLLLEAINQPIARLTFRARDGAISASLDYAKVRRDGLRGGHFNVLHGELQQVLRRRAEDDGVSPRFGMSIASMQAHEHSVDVAFNDGSRAAFDLVIGADGVRSRVRSLAFGPGNGFTRFLGYDMAACVVDEPALAAELSGEFATLSVPGRQVGLCPIGGGRLGAFFLYGAKPRAKRSRQRIRSELLRQFDDFGWYIPRLLAACLNHAEIFSDAVTQIEMPHWVNHRVTLVGDACGAVSLVAGQGASLAMSGAFTLARLLDDGANIDGALAAYERTFRPVVRRRQRSGRRMARWVLPDTQWRLALRDSFLKAAALPGVARLAARSLIG